MFGMDMMIKEMLGISPEELKAQVAQSMQQAQAKIEAYDLQLSLISHKVTRIEKLLDAIARNNGVVIDKEDEVNGPGKLTQQ